MLKTVSDLFYRVTRGWLIVAVLVVLVLFVMLTLPGITTVSGDIEGLDTLFFYTPQQAFANVAAYSAEARATLNTFHLTVDVVNPILYSTLLVLLLSWLFPHSFMAAEGRRLLNIFPFGALLSDLLENSAITLMMSVYPAQPHWLAWVATVSTMFKFSFIYVSFGLMLVGVAGWLFARVSQGEAVRKPAA